MDDDCDGRVDEEATGCGRNAVCAADGSGCECETGFTLRDDLCRPECALDCGQGTCAVIDGAPRCVCLDPGFTGEGCDVDVDECALGRSGCPDGTCVNTMGGFRCDCGPGSVRAGRSCVPCAGALAFFSDLGYREIADGDLSVSIGDVDADGDPDLLTWTRSDDEPSNLTLRLNAGGRFDELIRLGPQDEPLSRSGLMDVDGDGRLDVLRIERHDTRYLIAWHLNTPDGFAAPTDPVHLTDLPLITVADYMQVGRSELYGFGWNREENRTELTRLRIEAGEPVAEVVWSEPTDRGVVWTSFPPITDLNTDGFNDLILKRGGALEVAFGGADGFGEMSIVMEQTPAVIKQIGDFDGDLDMDMVAYSRETGTIWMENQGDLRFETLSIGDLGTPTGPRDLDGDGDVDLIFSFHQNATWFPDAPTDDPFDGRGFVNRLPGSQGILDIDGDGIVDRLLSPSARASEGGVRWQVGLGDGRHTRVHALHSRPVDRAVIVDVDADGYPDVMLFDGPEIGRLRYDATAWPTLSVPPSMELHGTVRFADLDGDGRPEAVRLRGATLSILPNEDGVFGPPRVVADGLAATGPLAVADVDADGLADIVIAVGGDQHIYRNQPGQPGQFEAAYTLRGALRGWTRTVRLARDELPALVARRSDAALWSWPLALAVEGRSPAPRPLGLAEQPRLGASFDDLDFGDLDGDGLDDLVAVTPMAAVVYRNVGGRFEAQPEPVSVAPADRPFRRVRLGDMDGDGDLDVVINARKFSSHVGWVEWHRNTGAGAFEPAEVLEPARRPGDVTLSLIDVDNDGNLDIVERVSGSTGILTYAYMSHPQCSAPEE